MVGDGVNDAPVCCKLIGVAMGTGSDVAIGLRTLLLCEATYRPSIFHTIKPACLLNIHKIYFLHFSQCT